MPRDVAVPCAGIGGAPEEGPAAEFLMARLIAFLLSQSVMERPNLAALLLAPETWGARVVGVLPSSSAEGELKVGSVSRTGSPIFPSRDVRATTLSQCRRSTLSKTVGRRWLGMEVVMPLSGWVEKCENRLGKQLSGFLSNRKLLEPRSSKRNPST